MIGDLCNVDWLSEQLLPSADDADVASAAVPDDVDESSGSSAPEFDGRGVEESVGHQPSNHGQSINEMISMSGDFCPNCPCDRSRRVVILDCRSPTDYLASHIVGAVHLAVPQLMLRRLKSGHLPASSVIGCLQDEGRENFNRRWKSEIIVLHDERSHDVISDVTSSSAPTSSSSDVISVLLRRLKEDGCRVCLLEGGYEAFNQKYPHLCVSAKSGSCCTAPDGVDDLERDDGINVDEGDEGDFIDESSRDIEPSSSISAMCSSAPPMSSTNTTAFGLQRLRLHRHNRPNRPVIGHRFTHHHNVHHTHSHHQHPIGSCNQHFSCPSSLSSSSLSSCCSSANSSNSSSVSSSSLSISSCPVTAANVQQHQQLLSATASFPVEVLPYLYLGNARSSADSEALHRNGIRYILNVTPNVPNSFAGTDSFHYLQIPIDDHWSQDLTAYFPDAIAFIDEARRSRCGVLVHCLAGVSRSVTVTVAYLMHALRLTLNDAFDHVRHCKPDISPNFSFMGQLLDYERLLSTERDRQVSAVDELSIDETGAERRTSSVEDGDRKPRPLAAVAEPVGDQSMFLSPPVASCHRAPHRKQSSSSNSSDCQCSTSTTTTNGGITSIDGSQRHCDVCCRHVVGMTTDVVNTENVCSRGVGGGGSSSCYSSPLSSLSSLSSSSAVNAAVSSTSSSSTSSAFDYDTIPMSSSPSPMSSNFS